MAEGARLESVYTGNRIGGSNPPPSATYASGFGWQATKWTGARRRLGGGVSPVALPRAKGDYSRYVVRLFSPPARRGHIRRVDK